MEETVQYGALCLIPVATVIVLALLTKRFLDPMIGGVLVGWIIIEKWNFLFVTGEKAIEIASNPDIMWIVIVCSLFGSLIALLQKSGGSMAFGNVLSRFVRGPKTVQLFSWLLGLVIFVDDYLNCLVVGSSMRRLSDANKIPRAMLAYICDATAAPICVLIPFSTWSI
ncbi:MAG: sodium:proton antiporter, partial [Clostridiales Family XIII bacterium]|nr:sodium:proton antiporter [Clostridiales Family XIII bacterium]